MTRSMRSRFSEPTPPPRPPRREAPSSGNSPISWLGQILALALVCGMAYMAYYWSTNDISGEYGGINPYLGTVRLTLLRKPATLSGDITYARLAPLALLPSSTIADNHLNLQFSQAAAGTSGAQPRSATFTGDIQNGQINGTIQEQGYSFNVTLTRSSLSSLQQQMQSHLPF